jgi:hypothetical protein
MGMAPTMPSEQERSMLLVHILSLRFQPLHADVWSAVDQRANGVKPRVLLFPLVSTPSVVLLLSLDPLMPQA